MNGALAAIFVVLALAAVGAVVFLVFADYVGHLRRPDDDIALDDVEWEREQRASHGDRTEEPRA